MSVTLSSLLAARWHGGPRPQLLAAMKACRLRAAFDESKIKRDDQGQFDDLSAGEALAAAEYRAPRGSDQVRELVGNSFLNQPLTNKHSGLVANVSGDSLDEMLHWSVVKRSDDVQAHLHAVANMDQLFPHALHREQRPGKKGDRDRDLQAIHHLEVPMPYSGDVWKARITVKEFKQKGQGNRIYLVRALQIKKPASQEESPESAKPQPVQTSPAGFSEKFDSLAAVVKQKMGERSQKPKGQAKRHVPRLIAALIAGRAVKAPLTLTLSPEDAGEGTKQTATKRMRFASGRTTLRIRCVSSRKTRPFHGIAYTGDVMFPTIEINGERQAIKVVLDLASLRIPHQEIPVLDDHDESTDGTVGRTKSITNDGRQLAVRGVVYPRKLRSHGIIFANDAGHRWQLSVGTDQFTIEDVPAGQAITINGRTFTGPVGIVRHAYLTDLSFVAVGGDDHTSAVIEAGRTGCRVGIAHHSRTVGNAHPTERTLR